IQASAWSDPPLNIELGTELTSEDLHPENAERVTAKVKPIPTQLMTAEAMTFNIELELLNFDFATASAFPTFTFTDIDDGDSTDSCTATGGTIFQQATPIAVTGALDIAEDSGNCQVTITVTLPDKTTMSTEGEIALQREETASAATTGRFPTLSGLNTIVRGTEVEVSWDPMEMNGHTFVSLQILNSAGNPLTTSPSVLDATSGSASVLASLFTVGAENTVRLVLIYRPAGETTDRVMELSRTFSLSEPTILSFGFDPATPASIAETDTATLRVLLLRTNEGDLTTDVEITDACTWSGLTSSSVSDNVLTPNDITADVTLTLICTLPANTVITASGGSRYKVGPMTEISTGLTITAEAEITDPSVACTDEGGIWRSADSACLLAAQAACYGDDLVAGVIGTGDDIGVWSDSGCWLLADSETESCDNVCTTQSLTCIADAGGTLGSWNDDSTCTICNQLTGASVCGPDDANTAPMVVVNPVDDSFLACSYRNTSVSVNQDCSLPPSAGRQRICKCE
ncbi:MAG: hypothetical protein V1913_12310, partial [Fibrobacterota bacterium]